jgi:HD-GYP domain-containing protein (c-di-GMP phosphodiesterase class II)
MEVEKGKNCLMQKSIARRHVGVFMDKKQSECSIVEQVDMDSIEEFCRELYSCDEYTLMHVQHVADLMAGLASQMGLSSDDINLAYLVGVIHDVGKIKTPHEILHKPGRLTNEEFGIMKLHAEAGADMLAGIAGAGPIVPVMRHHHERFDGKGYPYGLRGDQIPVLSRMLAVCDAFDAMTTHRCYRDPVSLRDSLLELRRCAGTQFDPCICEAFIEFIGEQFGFILDTAG